MGGGEYDFEERYKGFTLQGRFVGSLEKAKSPRLGEGYRVDALKKDYTFSVTGIGYQIDIANTGYSLGEEGDQEMVKEQLREGAVERVKERIDKGVHEDKKHYDFRVNLTPKSESSSTNLENFFEKPRQQSIVKSEIVRKYFYAWAKNMVGVLKPPPGRIYYLDLFAGRGKYSDGTVSTPLKVLQAAIAHKEIRSKLVAVFNDADAETIEHLEQAAKDLEGYETLRFEPHFTTETVTSGIAERVEKAKIEPVLMFIDPWGYKGISLRLINAILKKRASEVIFFFNYQRFNPAISNPYIVEPIYDLLGEERAKSLEQTLEEKNPNSAERRLLVMQFLEDALTSRKGRYVLPFRFFSSESKRLTHHLVHVCTHPHGHNIMKDIMAREGDETAEGIPAFEYRPNRPGQRLLFENPKQELKDELLAEYAGASISVKDLYFDHGLETQYIMPNYQTVLKELEAAGLIRIEPPAEERRKGTLTEAAIVHFPS